MIKKRFMTQIWRIQQSQTLVGIIVWSAALAGIFWDVVSPVFVRLGLVSSEQVGLGIVILFFTVLVSIIIIGTIYDRVLKLWREQNVVAIERNPFMRENLTPKEILLWRKVLLRTLREVGREDPGVQEDVEFMERWIEKSLATNPGFDGYVRQLEKWVKEEAPSS